jgi:phosphatidylserine/phosphatidylglycerophosphate/cardiolipin synthase-like enzyme
MANNGEKSQKTIDLTIRRNLARLRKPGVLIVRPRYEIANHQLTGRLATVATVHTKKAILPKADLLPVTIGNTPVDVREATAYQRLRAHDPAAAKLAQIYSRPEDKEPDWPLEREISTGRLITAKNSPVQNVFTQSTTFQSVTHRSIAAHDKKPHIKYVPAKASLNPVTAATTITAHVNPDAGLTTLQSFLAGTKQSLTVGMYDFTSGRILEPFVNNLNDRKTLQMVLDNPPPNPTRDQTDVQTVEEFKGKLGKDARITRALDREDVFASAWMFPYAYHIKVIVRDRKAFWLSSGNLNNSNQPDLASPPLTLDRDWHLIVEDAGLAKIFHEYLNQDFISAGKHQAKHTTADAAAVRDANAKLAAEADPPPLKAPRASPVARVAAQTFKKVKVTITPLLTPDTMPGNVSKGQYLTNIISLLSSAKKRLYIQLQYIEASKGTGNYDTLLKAIADRVQAGVDVRLIESLEYGEKWAEKMKAEGVDLTANIRLQPNVHNKGFVVGSQTVVVSSRNFSPAGVVQNRDAGLIIVSDKVAKYFEPILLSDWNKAKPFAPKAVPVSLALGRIQSSNHRGLEKVPVKSNKRGLRTQQKSSRFEGLTRNAGRLTGRFSLSTAAII